ncbi:MAG: peptidoglycan DD-metalloendopeptidase family protein [Anaerolineae bacterium]|nr:peptidoglycan DD-metalloendopeptidase family protein [Anaerolineae bacterium]
MPAKSKMLRMMILVAWLVLALLVVMPVLAQGDDGTSTGTGDTAQTEDGAPQVPEDLDDIAVRLMPLLVGAALIERTIELLFDWVERAILDASHYLNQWAARVTGLVQVDLHQAWENLNDLTGALLSRQAEEAPPDAGNPYSSDPADWPLGQLEEALIAAQLKLDEAQDAIETAMDSPLYVSHKKMAAAWLSMGFGVLLALVANLRLFDPLGVEVADSLKGGFDIFDLVMAGILMGLGTEWVHQVIGLLIQGKGLLGRAASGGAQVDPDLVADMALMAVEGEMQTQTENLRENVLKEVIEKVPSALPAERTIEILPAVMASKDAVQVPAVVLEQLAAKAGTSTTLPGRETAPAESADRSIAASLVADYIALYDVAVTVRGSGVNVRTNPSLDSDILGGLPDGSRQEVRGLVFRDVHTWLQVPWQRDDQAGQFAWIAGEYTDFARSSAYSQVTEAWYESRSVLRFRRTLVRELLRVRGTDPAKLAEVDDMAGRALENLEDALAEQTMLPQYDKFWAMQARLGLPDPFEFLPVHTSPPELIYDTIFSGFGPTTLAFDSWQIYYDRTRGLHSGVDYFVPEGSPLVAVCDGVIVDFPFMDVPAERSLALRAYLPRHDSSLHGPRVLSNLVIGYGHLTGNPSSDLVHVGDEVRAGQIIGTSGWPVYMRDDGTVGIQRNNAHLHIETHLVTDGTNTFGSNLPLNPLLFWTPRLIALQARLAAHDTMSPYPSGGHPFGRLGFFSIGMFSTRPARSIVWEYTPEAGAPWPEGVYALDAMLAQLRQFRAYPTDGSSPF